MNATLLLILLAFLSIYSYCVYPLVLLAARKLAGRSGPAADAGPSPRETGAGGAPRMSLIITAHNESERIRAKLENSLSLAYDPGRLEILVASDASTDGTDAIVEGFPKPSWCAWKRGKGRSMRKSRPSCGAPATSWSSPM